MKVPGSVWVFGYGSLVSPESLGGTLGRMPSRGIDFVPAEVQGWSRRWNYGIALRPGAVTGPESDGLTAVVALGLITSPEEWMNGILALVSPDELDRLDARERNYDRVDVTEQVRVLHDSVRPRDIHQAVVYVPRKDAISVYEHARTERSAAIERRYWDLVDNAFALLGPGQAERYRDTTPPPDVPILDITRV